MSRKPLVGDQSLLPVYHDDSVKVFKSMNEYEYYKVAIKGIRVKYFYGEMAHSDVPRFVQDELGDMKYWRLLG